MRGFRSTGTLRSTPCQVVFLLSDTQIFNEEMVDDLDRLRLRQGSRFSFDPHSPALVSIRHPSSRPGGVRPHSDHKTMVFRFVCLN